jgi:hypothetical protein
VGDTPGIVFIEKSIYLFGGNPDISLKTSSNYFNTMQSSTFGTLSLGASSMCAANT